MRFAAAAFAVLCVATAAEARTWRIDADAHAQQALQQALTQARPGDTVRLDRGRYELTQGLTLGIDRVTISGEGQDRSILSFSGQSTGDGLAVSANGVELRDFAVENAHGDGVVVRDCQGATLRGVRAEWATANARNGAHGLAAVNCSNVVIRDSIARGASAAGILVGQSRTAIVRDSVAENNVAGIAIENSYNADVFRNLATHNAAGIVVVDLPGLQQQDGHAVRVFENTILANGGRNFAPAESPASGAPSGTGVLIMGTRDAVVFDNEIGEHGTVNVLIAAYRGEGRGEGYNPLPRNIVIRDNRFGRAGFAPGGELEAVAEAGVTMPDVLWDGADTYFAGGMPRAEPVRIVVRDNRAASGGQGRFLSLGVNVAGAPLTEGEPSANFPPLLELQEPGEVEIDD